jgi:xanthine dehydrogenase molybdenum-binding subunit
MQFYLNGASVEVSEDPETPLLTYLRETAGIISAKDGCSPQAACGCCAVQVGDKAVLSCVTPLKKVAGQQVVTTEGMGTYLQKVFANSFVSKGGVQCGYCIPGIVMQSHVLLQKNPSPTRRDIEEVLTPHLCRCTGYKKIVDAVMCAADAIRKEEDVPLPTTTGKIGERLPKYEAGKLVLGQHPYVDDVRMAGMLHGVLKFSDHPRAMVRRIDTSTAASMPGVVRILTAKDVPAQRNIGLIKNDWLVYIDEGEVTRYIGDVLACVVADTEANARAAVAAIQVEYEVLEPIVDRFKALEPDSPRVHPDMASNQLSRSACKRGDLSAAEVASAYTASGVFETQRIEHGFMEPECAIGYPVDDALAKVEIRSQGQGVYEDRRQIALMLGVPESAVRVILHSNGGGFGGKEDLTVQGHAALAAWHLGKPVKVKLSRAESLAMHPKRHPIWMDYSIGCDAQGKFTFCKVRFVGDSGAYASVGMKVLERSAGHATGAYTFPVADVEAIAVYTNNIPCGAMRGFGVNQAAFGLENLIDDLCEQGGFDRWQIRWDNALTPGAMTSTGQVLEGGVGIRATLEAVKDEFYRTPYAGLACGLKNTGAGNGHTDQSTARITVVSPNEVLIDQGWTEMGQGVNTISIQVVCEETGLPPEIMRVRTDTAAETVSGMTTASRATSLVGHALIDAGRKLKADLDKHSLAELTGRSYDGGWACDWTTKPGADVEKIITHYSYSYASQVVALDDDGNISKITAAHDAGRVFNPTLFEGQLEGSLHMGLGYAISEELEMEGGHLKSNMLRKCGILRAKEMPEMEIIGVEVADPNGPYGAKGVGEIGLVPTAGAVANALFRFDGVRRHKLPMRLEKKRKGGKK